ncbi:MAG: FecR domain-containing protein [Spirochaetaceae bacterium]
MKQLRYTAFFTGLLVFLLSAPLFAQNQNPSAILAFYENEAEIEVRTKEDNPVAVSYGMALQSGESVHTGETVAEIQLEPNGTIIKLSRNTVFNVEELQDSEDTSNKFGLVRGKMRSVAAGVGKGTRYQVSTPSAVCGVRGTDFGLISRPEEEEKAFVNQGAVEYRKLATDESINLTSGMIADALADTFEAVQMSREQLNEMLRDVQFQELDPADVPGHTPEEPPAPEDEDEEPAEEDEVSEEDADAEEDAEEDPDAEEEELAAEEAEGAAEDGETEEPADSQVQERTVGGEPADAPEGTGLSPGLNLVNRRAASYDSGFSDGGEGDGAIAGFLGDYLGFEIGSVTMDGDTYSKAIIKPRLELGRLKMSLYLPIIYQNDLFDPDDWYEPKGNNEWSFGADQDWNNDPWNSLADLARDIALKIHYIQWAEQRDPFYFKLGNLDNMSLGHGSIMKNYANDKDFPSIRRVGFNMGIRGESGGFEAVVNDFTEPYIFGGRVFVTPIGKLSFGASTVTDIDPVSTAEREEGTDFGDAEMSFIVSGVDVELPIVESDLLSIVPYADAAVFIPEKNGNFYHDTLYDSSTDFSTDSFRNYGLSAGFLGNIAMVDYTLEYRYYNGLFRHSFFGPNYERARGRYAEEVFAYIDAFDNDESLPGSDKTTMGVFGDAQATLFNAFAFSAGYMWPWQEVDMDEPESFGDELSMSLRVLPDVIPVLGIYGGVGYTRTNFVPMLVSDELTFFDSYASFGGEIVYPLGPTIDLAAVFSTSMRRKEDGSLYYDEYGKPEMVPNITIETRLGF